MTCRSRLPSTHVPQWSLAATLLLVAACGNETTPGNSGAGGTAATGGVRATGGATASGGVAAGGGTTGSGGSQATDAGISTGGVRGTGGVSGSGGNAAAGGTASTGGAVSTGGGASTGGVRGTGGAAGAGGTLPVGGTSGLGGMTGAGGATTDGGADANRLDVATPNDARAADAGLDTSRGSDAGGAGKNTCLGPASAALANAGLPAGYCAWTWASGLSGPRGIARNANGDMLVTEQGANRITLLHDDDGNGVSDSNERVVLGTASGIGHGIALQGGYLYASSATTVYRWAYTGGRQALGASQTVVSGIPSGGHSTRTLLFDGEGRLYVAVGSGGNLDSDSSRARLIRYPASALGTASTFAQGEVFADGLRNEVGITLDSRGRVWGVENGMDNLNRTDLGGDIHNDNPGEELNLFAEPGKFYGYPYCWSEFVLAAGSGPTTQWAHPTFMNDGTHTDAWCKNPANVVPPVLSMQAHSAPLDIKFYQGGAFPADMNGSAIVTFHGSWNRSPATGYKVVRIPFGADGMPSGEPTPLLEYSGAGDKAGDWTHRPVGIETGLDGRLFITSDASNVVIAIGHGGA